MMAEWTNLSLALPEFLAEGGDFVSLGDFKRVQATAGKTAHARFAPVWAVSDGQMVCLAAA